MLTQHLLYTRLCSRCWNIAMKQTKFYNFFLLFSCSVVSQLFETPCMHCSMARLPCPSPTPGVHPNPCPLSRRCNLTLCHPLLLLPSIFSSIGVFPMSWLFVSSGQGIGASASVLPKNIQDCFPLGWTGWISLQSKGLSRVFSSTTAQKHQFFSSQLSLWSNSHIHT